MKSSGYTLVEIMIVVAIIGVVSAIAYPSYQGYLGDTYRAQAASDLRGCAMALERYYSNDFTYSGAATNTICSSQSPSEGEPQYDILVDEADLSDTAFTIRARPVDDIACGTLNCIVLDQTGDQTME